MLKRTVSITIVLIILTFSVAYVWGADKGSVRLTLDEAIETAIENETYLKLLDKKIQLAERKLSLARSAAVVAPDKHWDTDSKRISNKYEELLYPLQREAELNELKWQRVNSEKKLKTEVIKYYFQILQSQKVYNNLFKIKERTKSEYNIIEKKVQSGIAAESELTPYKIAVDDVEIKLNSCKRDIDNLMMTLNEKLGFELDSRIILVEMDTPKEVLGEISIDALAAEAVMSSHEIAKLKSDKLISETKYNILYQYSYTTPEECEVLKDSITDIEHAIADQKVSVELKVRQDYNNLLNLIDDISILQTEYDQKVKQMEITNKKYELGMCTYLDYIKAQGDVDTAKVNLDRAELDYYLAVLSFKEYIDSNGSIFN
jgi:hypothetical protein